MIATCALFAEPTTATPVVVIRPRRTDAVGDALRQAFRFQRALPDTWTGALRQLDTID